MRVFENADNVIMTQSFVKLLTERMKWLQRLNIAKSSPGPGALMPTDENKSVEKYMSSFTASAPFSHSLSSVAAMKINLFGYLKSCLEE